MPVHARSGDRLALLIKTGNTHKERMMLQTIIYTFKKCKEEGEVNTVNIDGSTQMVVVLTIKEVSYLVVGIFHNLLGPLSYLCW